MPESHNSGLTSGFPGIHIVATLLLPASGLPYYNRGGPGRFSLQKIIIKIEQN